MSAPSGGAARVAAWLRAAWRALWTRWRRSARDDGPAAPPDEGDEEDEPWQPEHDEPVVIPIGDVIDLHWFPPRDAGEIVDAYLEAARERGLRDVRIIHGRGRGVQRHRVRQHLARSPHVEAFGDAPADRGGWGATLVRLRERDG